MKYKETALLISVLCVFYFPSQLKSQSCCEEDDEITLCYLSSTDYCQVGSSVACLGYSLDGEYMQGALLMKLQSLQNFGPNGAVDCNLVLKKLDLIQSAQTISDCGCDIVFVPVVAIDPTTNSTNSDTTSIPSPVLESILEWSLECKQNLTIVFQAESAPWGYTLENANVNPNTQGGSSFSDAIFDGPFGTISQINQGGSYQGVFTDLPDTGTEILARDNNGNTTIALDLATNDIIIGDIGIFCSPAIVGPVSPGSGINNQNDEFVCNIFALGCQLATATKTENQIFALCPMESVVLPSGQTISDFGNYIDTLQDISGCDSIITNVEIIEKIIEPTNLNYSGCEGDSFTVVLNNNIYNEVNPFGQELLLTEEGCDSIVNVDLFFATLDPNTSIDSTVNMTACNVSPFNNSIPDEYAISWRLSENLSCLNCSNPLINTGCDNLYNLSIVDEIGCTWNYDIAVTYDYGIYIPNAFSPNGDGVNDYFSLGLSSYCEDGGAFEIKIFNRWGGEVFSSEDLLFRWDGTTNDEASHFGVYAYWIRLNCEEYKGDLTILK